MLSNIVGTLLAFVTIMLMLSLIVTSLVQFAQASLRLRGRNLLVGVAALLKKYVPNATLPGNSTSSLRSNTHLALAAHVLNIAQASPKLLADPNATGRVLLGPPVSWIPSDDLAQAVASTLATATTATAAAVPLANGAHTSASPGTAAAGALPPTEPAQPAIQQTFENMEPAIAKRFQFIIRIWTVAISFVIAFAFQLSTPELLKSLPSQDANRQAILAAVPSLTNEATRQLGFSTDDVLKHTSQLMNRLDTFGFSPKLDNFEFYISALSADAGQSSNRAIHWSNIAGVLITGILLSLGAPFWFEQLKNLSSLRDSMNPSAAAAKSK